jgi:hypothetical protein
MTMILPSARRLSLHAVIMAIAAMLVCLLHADSVSAQAANTR